MNVFILSGTIASSNFSKLIIVARSAYIVAIARTTRSRSSLAIISSLYALMPWREIPKNRGRNTIVIDVAGISTVLRAAMVKASRVG